MALFLRKRDDPGVQSIPCFEKETRSVGRGPTNDGDANRGAYLTVTMISPIMLEAQSAGSAA